VPKTGKMVVRSGILISKNTDIWRRTHPRISNKITLGILVFEADKSNRYAISKSRQKVMMMVVVIF